MESEPQPKLLEALLDSWNRSNTILLNVLHALPEGGLDARALPESQSVVVQFAHVQNTRLFWLEQVASRWLEGVPELFHREGEAWMPECDPQRVAEALNASARAIADAVRGKLEAGEAMQGEHARYDHPLLLLQHMLWHEGYHVGQIKLALKRVGVVWSDEVEEKTIWSVWRTETWA